MKVESHWSRAAIRIFAPQIGVDEVSRQLGVAPRYQFPKREQRFKERGIWYFWSGIGSDEHPRKHISVLIDFIRIHRESLKKLTATCKAEISCAFASKDGQASFMVDAEMIAELAQVRFNLFLSLYPPAEEAEEQLDL